MMAELAGADDEAVAGELPPPPPQAGGAAAGPANEEHGRVGGQTFQELLMWGWSAYERLGTLPSAHSIERDEYGHDAYGARTAYAADVCDLGRLLLRLLLQPDKLRAIVNPQNNNNNNNSADNNNNNNGIGGVNANQPGGGIPALAQVVPPNGGAHGPMPPASSFAPSLQRLLLQMLHPRASRRPTALEVLTSDWAREPYPGVVRPLCVCWRLQKDGKMDPRRPFAGFGTVSPRRSDRLGGGTSGGGGTGSSAKGGSACGVAMDVDGEPPAPLPRCGASDLRLLRRRVPALRALSLAYSPEVTDEWLEVLAETHAASLTQLDLTGCAGLSSSARPLRALARLTQLSVLRLPAERWHENDLADALVHLPRLKEVDAATYEDLRRERDALTMQCQILGHATRG